MKASWVNLILKITSFIQRSKGKLPTAHALASIVILVGIIVAEILLAVVSFPLYLVESRIVNEGKPLQQYKARRAITLSTVVGLALIWVIKIALIAGSIFFFSGSSPTTIHTSAGDSTEIDQEQIFAVQRASLNTSLMVPVINQVTFQPDDGIEFLGTTQPSQQVFLYVQRLGGEDSEEKSKTITVITTQADSSGNFSVKPDTTQFQFHKGEYQVSATTLDSATKTFSPTGPAVQFSTPENISNTVQLTNTLDTLLNIGVLFFILMGVLLTLLIV